MSAPAQSHERRRPTRAFPPWPWKPPVPASSLPLRPIDLFRCRVLRLAQALVAQQRHHARDREAVRSRGRPARLLQLRCLRPMHRLERRALAARARLEARRRRARTRRRWRARALRPDALGSPAARSPATPALPRHKIALAQPRCWPGQQVAPAGGRLLTMRLDAAHASGPASRRHCRSWATRRPQRGALSQRLAPSVAPAAEPARPRCPACTRAQQNVDKLALAEARPGARSASVTDTG